MDNLQSLRFFWPESVLTVAVIAIVLGAVFLWQAVQLLRERTPERAMRLFGYPTVSLAQLIDWTADWISRSLPSLGKATHYDTRDGTF